MNGQKYMKFMNRLINRVFSSWRTEEQISRYLCKYPIKIWYSQSQIVSKSNKMQMDIITPNVNKKTMGIKSHYIAKFPKSPQLIPAFHSW